MNSDGSADFSAGKENGSVHGVGLCRLVDQGDHFAIIWKTTFRSFRKDQVPVQHDLKYTAAARDQICVYIWECTL